MRRIMSLVLLVVAVVGAGIIPSSAAQGGVVVTLGSTFVPGDNKLPAQVLRVPKGSSLTYANLGIIGHSVTEDVPLGVTPLFDSGILLPGKSGDVLGVSDLAAKSYAFICTVHEYMKGTLIVF